MQVLFFIALAVIGQPAGKQVEANQDQALQGLGPFRLVVPETTPDSPVTTAQLETVVKEHLSHLGIETSKEPYAFLVARVRTTPVKDRQGEVALICFDVSIAYRDVGELISGKSAAVTVWRTSTIAFAGPSVAAEHIRDTMKAAVGEFAKAWTYAHPAGQGAPTKP